MFFDKFILSLNSDKDEFNLTGSKHHIIIIKNIH